MLLGSLKSDFSNLVLNLEGGESLMVEDLPDLSAIESEMSVAEVNERYNTNKEEQPRVISSSLLFEGVVSHFVTKGLIMNLGVLLEGHSIGVTREGVSVTKERIIV